MVMSYSKEFQIRYYECDAFGHLNNSNYVRYILETAREASVGLGYQTSRFSQYGRKWQLFETDIEYLRPARFGDKIKLTSRVFDMNQDISRQVFEFILVDSNEVAAKAITEWRYINSITNQPERIPQEIINSNFPDGIPDHIPARIPFPSPPDPPAGKFEMEIKVIWQDIGVDRTVDNAVYLNYIEECGMQVIAAHGWPVDRMLDKGFAILFRRHHFLYLKVARLNDRLLISTWASNVRRSTATRHYLIRNKLTDDLLAIIHSVGVWVDLTTGRPVRIPEDLLADFAPNIV
jgi:acyl-CoA thioester hydrolase